MIKVALTGNIASGKTQVQKVLVEFYPVLDCDEVAHNILLTSREVFKYFGTNDRKLLAKKVFDNPIELKKLEEIIHPLVKTEIEKFFEINSVKKMVFVAIPQLFEASFESLFDKIILVCANDELRLERLIVRNGYDREYAIKRINSQMKQELKIAKSDFVIENNSDLNALKERVYEIIKSLELL